MPSRTRVRALIAVLALAAGTRVEALLAPELCGGDLGPVLTVGWPVGRAAEIPRLMETIGNFHHQVGRCPSRALQVNIAYGTDYELSAWISTGAVDAALLTPLSVDVSRRDGVALLSVASWSDQKVVLEPEGKTLDEFFRRIGELGSEGAERVFLTLPSHLSNELYVLLEAAASHAAMNRLEPGEFWPDLFAHLCFRPLDATGSSLEPCVLAPNGQERAPVELALALRHRRAPGPGASPPLPDPRLGGSLPEWLAVRAEIAQALFRFVPDGRPSFPELAARTKKLFDDPESPEEIRRIAAADPRLGTRGFDFTIGEALGLLDAHGRATGSPQLALVLPGGGVKAAYQTTVLDALYGQGWLRNPLADAYGLSPGREPLEVDLVTGTSGGALVGYFVSRLDASGPFDLTCRLWYGGPGCPQALDYTKVFPPADLLRYLSLVVVFAIFSVALAAFALRRGSPFSLERLALPPDEAKSYLSRPLLALSATALLVATPFAVRFVNGADHQEHIPDVEGFVYLLLALLAMFADQCLVARIEDRPPSAGRIAAATTIGAGLLTLLPPLVTTWWEQRRGVSITGHALFDLDTPFWAAFCLLAPVFVVPLLLARSRSLGLGTVPGARGFLLGLAEFALLAVVALWLFLGIGLLRSSIDSMGPFLFGLLLVAALLLFLRPPPASRRATPRLQALYFGSLFVAALFVIAVARPAKLSAPGAIGLFEIVALSREPSQLGVKLGSLAITVGALLVFTGTLFALATWRPRYRLENVRSFATALAVCLGHAGASFALVALFARLGWVSFFELTLDYWLALAIVAWGLAVTWLLAAGLFARGKLREAFEFLASPHPNGRFRVRRHVRMVHFAIFAWGFWNLIVAPGLYGNRSARGYLEDIARDFGTHRDFTAPLLVPANALQSAAGETDGSRFFLIVPKALRCPPIPRHPASGGRWHVFHVGSPGGFHDDQADHCRELDSSDPIQSMIFASGSPFPVFPAHRVVIPGEAQPEFLIDGGYSNNVPIAPGQNLGVDQVLVLDSTNPEFGRSSSGLGRRIAWVMGSLVDDFLRLPGYLFGRAQVLDLQSRRDFFVVRVAPHRSHGDGWPFLADFRAEVVERMTATAREDLGRRIARVESWGKPRFVRSGRVEGRSRPN